MDALRKRAPQPTRREALEAVFGPWGHPADPTFTPADLTFTPTPSAAQGSCAGSDPDAASGPASARDRAWAAAATVCDPELPVLSIADLGVLRDVQVDEHGAVTVVITPTYSGCPMMDLMARDVAVAVRHAGFDDVQVHTVLAPAWTTDWLSDDGRRKLEEFGIAPPTGIRPTEPVLGSLHVRCPHCRSLRTWEVSHFGSTACKALYECRACGEPFDYFKAH